MRFLLLALIGFVGMAVESWALMVLVGVVHGEWFPALPTLSYLSSLRIAGAVALPIALAAVVYLAARGVSDE